jgi:poly(3-hydroxybutyrate) depolymerase
VLLVLHGGPDRAEGMWAIQTRRRFDVLASRNSFIVVYANAVPGHGTDPLLPRLPNEGRWHVQEDVSKAVDDEEYLQLVVEDLLRREVIDGRNDIYLVGHAEGAMMALQAAAHRPDFYTGVAALMPYYQASPPTLLHDARLSKVLFVALDDLGTRMAQHWALALGIPQSSIDASELGALPDRVKEGFDYELDGSMPLSTRDSTVELMDLRSPEPKGPNVRMFDVHRASHFWPNPTADDDERLVDSVGFRNQDIDGADETWRFFSGRGLPPLQPNDDAAPEPANDAPN